jgi:hypothetical protein
MRRPAYGSVGELFDAVAGGRSWRVEPMGKHVDSLFGSPFERGVIGDETFVVCTSPAIWTGS